MNLIKKAVNKIKSKIISKKERKAFSINLEKGIQMRYKRLFGKRLNLDHPSTFAEKINWLKLHDRDERIVLCADKFLVRDFVSKTIGNQYLIPLIGVWDKAKDVDVSALPNQFVLKPNNSSGRVFICKDKSSVDISKIKKTLAIWEKENLTKITGEWVYERIPFKIVCEKFLEDDIVDYKMYYANGDFIATQVITDRKSCKRFAYMDKEWNLLNIRRKGVELPNEIPLKPQKYDTMIKIADKLSKEFVFCRVDLYVVNEEVYFGELSFYPNNGFVCYETEEMDRTFSDKINLSLIRRK